MNYTPENINKLEPRQVFVFGSNTQGQHWGGAAQVAHKCFGAQWGVASGATGSCYAIPTCTTTHNKVNVDYLRDRLKEFFECVAGDTYNRTYFVTKIGCGIAGWDVDEIRTIFWDVVMSLPSEDIWLLRKIILPKEFVKENQEQYVYKIWSDYYDLYLESGNNDEQYFNAQRAMIDEFDSVKETYL